MEIHIVPYQLIILYRQSILGIILDLWDSILESGSLFNTSEIQFYAFEGNYATSWIQVLVTESWFLTTGSQF